MQFRPFLAILLSMASGWFFRKSVGKLFIFLVILHPFNITIDNLATFFHSNFLLLYLGFFRTVGMDMLLFLLYFSVFCIQFTYSDTYFCLFRIHWASKCLSLHKKRMKPFLNNVWRSTNCTAVSMKTVAASPASMKRSDKAESIEEFR